MRTIPEQNKLIFLAFAVSAVAGAILGAVLIAPCDFPEWLVIAGIASFGFFGALACQTGMILWTAFVGKFPFE